MSRVCVYIPTPKPSVCLVALTVCASHSRQFLWHQVLVGLYLYCLYNVVCVCVAHTT
jgi:hypothetical protein